MIKGMIVASVHLETHGFGHCVFIPIPTRKLNELSDSLTSMFVPPKVPLDCPVPRVMPRPM